MNRYADETTVHGIKEAWRANWIGRLFYLAVFATCTTTMVFQLKGLFHAYFAENVGTRIMDKPGIDEAEVSYYYCNDNAFPNIEAFRELLNTTRHHKHTLKKLQKCLYETYFKKNPYQSACAPYVKYFKKAAIVQELINSILLPRERGRPNDEALRKLRPHGYETRSRLYYVPFSSGFNEELMNLTDNGLQHTVMRYLMTNQSEQKDCGMVSNELHAVVSNSFDFEARFSSNRLSGKGIVLWKSKRDKKKDFFYDDAFDYRADDSVDIEMARVAFPGYGIREMYQYMSRPFVLEQMHNFQSALLDRELGRLAPSLEGVCWEFKPRSLSPETTSERRNDRLLVTHFGGVGPHLREMVFPCNKKPPYGMKHFRKQRIVDALKYAELHRNLFTTYTAVSMPQAQFLGFDQKIRVDARTPQVLIKYWTKKNLRKRRRGSPCRPPPWNKLDQAHCNQQRMSKTEIAPCELYVPASHFFPETAITNKTCITDHKGLLHDTVKWSVATELGEFSTGGRVAFSTDYGSPKPFIRTNEVQYPDLRFLRMNKGSRHQLMVNLLESSNECPRPCDSTSFHLEATFPLQTKEDVHKCAAALAHFFVPYANFTKGMRGDYKTFINVYTFFLNTPNPNWSNLPCSFVEFEPTTNGQISEEYFLHELSDLAANLGGTVGLFMGASVISVVQIFYICCLEKLFRMIKWNPRVFKRRTKIKREMTGVAQGPLVVELSTITSHHHHSPAFVQV